MLGSFYRMLCIERASSCPIRAILTTSTWKDEVSAVTRIQMLLTHRKPKNTKIQIDADAKTDAAIELRLHDYDDL
jgi:hypothetical protein